MTGNWIINYEFSYSFFFFEFSYSYFEEGIGCVSFISFLKLFFIEMQLLCSVLVSTVQQHESAVRIHLSLLFQISFPGRSPQSKLSEFPELHSMFSLVIYVIQSINSVCMSMSISQFTPSFTSHPTPPPTWWAFKNLFIFGCTVSLSLYQGFLQLQCKDLSLQRFLLLGSTGCRVRGLQTCGVGARQSRLIGSGTQTQQLWHVGFIAPWHVGSCLTRDQTCVSCIGRRILNQWTTREVLQFYLSGVDLNSVRCSPYPRRCYCYRI